jgi:hypothetical protein
MNYKLKDKRGWRDGSGEYFGRRKALKFGFFFF